MTPTEFVDGLAAVMEVERTELATVDRALAKQGLRQIARGRARPDITLREGLQIVCAWAGAKKLTDAAEEVKRLEHYHSDAVSKEKSENTKRDKDSFGSDFVREHEDLNGKNFFVVLSEIVRWLGEEERKAERLWVSIQKGGKPEIHYDCKFPKKKSLGFVWCGKLDLFNNKKVPPKPVEITASIRGTVLKWIFDVTEGA
ncbi:MAG: hypothetical protein R8G60_14830 [Roseovarius pacificus]|nr:hypothetical protein [Roseovarius pacificus]